MIKSGIEILDIDVANIEERVYLAPNLSTLRIKKNLSQQSVADDLKIPRSTYSSYETGAAEPNLTLLIKLARFYKVSIDDILKTLII